MYAIDRKGIVHQVYIALAKDDGDLVHLLLGNASADRKPLSAEHLTQEYNLKVTYRSSLVDAIPRRPSNSFPGQFYYAGGFAWKMPHHYTIVESLNNTELAKQVLSQEY